MGYAVVIIPLVFLFLWANHLQVIAIEKPPCIFVHRYEVHIINSLPSNSDPLVVHCASGDDDLGTHTLTSNQVFQWSFCENVTQTTLYFCHFSWGSKERAFEVFNKKLKGDCYNGLCFWEVRADGIYKSHGSDESFEKYIDCKGIHGYAIAQHAACFACLHPCGLNCRNDPFTLLEKILNGYLTLSISVSQTHRPQALLVEMSSLLIADTSGASSERRWVAPNHQRFALFATRLSPFHQSLAMALCK
ncbi:hypothetical protein Sango_2717600 [Sesamum angolense]|uniref:S-protein homolog n=1 Tax=Sesamum angolense TaxID=2727404 RepID=A0AAE1W386_9LAMI|nr:hypothetical protein Sango_2717600 [Sesamum angolense]